MRKLLYIAATIIFSSGAAWGAGNGTLGDPWDTLADFSSGVEAATCGTTVYLKSGTYASGVINLDKDCSSGNELTMSVSDTSVEDLGGAVLTTSSDHQINGSYLILKGIQSTASDFYWRVAEGRVTESLFNGAGSGAACLDVTGTDITNVELDHLTFNDCRNYTLRLRFDYGSNFRRNTGTHVHHNVFTNNAYGGNYEVLQIGDGAQSYGMESNAIIEFNYVYNNSSDNELFSVKTSSATIRYNVFDRNDGYLTIRGGRNSTIEGNYIYGVGTTLGGGIRVNGHEHKIINNYMEDTDPNFGIRLADGNNPQDSNGNSSGTADSFPTSDTIRDSSFSWTVDELIGGILWYETTNEWRRCDITDNTATDIECSGTNFSTDGMSAGDAYFVIASTSQYMDVHDVLVANNTVVNQDEIGIRIGYTSRPNQPFDITVLNNLVDSDDVKSGYYNYREESGAASITYTTNLNYETGAGDLWSGDGADPTTNSDPSMSDTGDMYMPAVSGAADGAGTANANVTTDIRGYSRQTPPDIGAAQVGQSDIDDVSVGCSFTGCGSYTVPGQVSGDAADPIVAITTPTTSPTYDNGSDNDINIGGTCSDNVAVDYVQWSNVDSGGGGTATGTESWSTTVALVSGTNAITVTCYDTSANTDTDLITVTYTPVAVTEPVAVGNSLRGTLH